MLSVEIFIDDTCIIRLGAQRIKGDMCPDTRNTYRMDGETKHIKHRYGDGAERLAIKMLKRYIAKKERNTHKEQGRSFSCDHVTSVCSDCI